RSAPDARLLAAGNGPGGRVSGGRREDLRDVEYRRKRHHELRLRGRQVSPAAIGNQPGGGPETDRRFFFIRSVRIAEERSRVPSYSIGNRGVSCQARRARIASR